MILHITPIVISSIGIGIPIARLLGCGPILTGLFCGGFAALLNMIFPGG